MLGLKSDVRIGDPELNFVKTYVSALSSVDKKHSFKEFSMEGQRVFPSAGNLILGYGLSGSVTRNLKVPKLQSLSASESTNSQELRLGKAFFVGNNLHKAFFKLGSLAYSPSDGGKFSPLDVGLSYMMRTEAFDINLGLSYKASRVF